MADYYVDSVIGSDLNDGLTSGTPLQTLARLQQFQAGNTDTYFVDPLTGSDLNSGLTREMAWATTMPADLVTLAAWQTVSYKLTGAWYLYRAPDMRMSQWLLPMDIVTNRMTNF